MRPLLFRFFQQVSTFTRASVVAFATSVAKCSIFFLISGYFGIPSSGRRQRIVSLVASALMEHNAFPPSTVDAPRAVRFQFPFFSLSLFTPYCHSVQFGNFAFLATITMSRREAHSAALSPFRRQEFPLTCLGANCEHTESCFRRTF